MNGAIFYSGRYGSTQQYANWISQATGLSAFSIDDPAADPADYDFVVLGSSIEYFKLTNRKWMQQHLPSLIDKQVLLYSVSGKGPGSMLEGWVANSLPAELVGRVKHVGLCGRLRHQDVGFFAKVLLYIGSLFNRDPKSSQEERYGFDKMDQSSIEPIVDWVREHQPAVTRKPSLMTA